MSRLRSLVRRPARRTARRLLEAAGFEVQRVADDSWLVGRGSRRVERITAEISLVTGSPPPMQLQRRLGHHLAAHEVHWVLERTGANVVLDVGANRGQFAEGLREAGYTGRIVSFEPLPEHVEVLRRKAAADPDWQVLPYAAGDTDQVQTINVVPGTMSSMLESSEFGRSWSKRLREPRPQEIEVRRLDGLLDEALAGVAEPRVFLKLDTQGYDLLAFRGTGERATALVGLMSEVSCVPIYEGMPRLTEQIAEYEAAGFELAGMYPVTIHAESLRVIEFDAVMVRPGEVRPA